MKQLQIIEYNEQRILTTAQLAEGYGASERKIVDNFNNNRSRYQEGKHFFCLEGDELRAFKSENEIFGFAPNLNRLYLWTERGALLHAKSLGTDKAWETYDMLVESYFQAKKPAGATCIEDVLIQSLQEMKEVKTQIAGAHRRIDDMQDVIRLDTTSWREESRKLVVRIAQKIGGNEYIQDVQAEIYALVEHRAGVCLKTRLTNQRRRMADEGVAKSRRDKLNRVDIIGMDKKLIEIYVAIIKEMAVKHGVSLSEAA